MKTKLTCLTLIFAMAGAVVAAPITFGEVSLLVRTRETDAFILQQLSTRRLPRALTAEQEAKLKADGASTALLEALRAPSTILPSAEAVAFEMRTEEQKKAVERAIAAEESERVVREAARAAALAVWHREQEEKAARARAEAEAAAQYAAASYAGDGGYGGYGCAQPPYFGFSSSCPTGIISSRPGSGHRPVPGYRSGGSISASGLHWQNGSSTIHASPGISYYQMGSNGSQTIGAGFSISGSGAQNPGICFGR